MLATAAYCCRSGGYILISLPPEGTRPTALQDRLSLIKFCRRISLEVVEDARLALGYETPFFEANALSAAGLHGVPANWRRGDLIVIRKMAEGRRPQAPGSHRKQDWQELSIGRMRLFVRRSACPSSSLAKTLDPVVRGAILPSVSRRDIRRRNAQVWTSGNRIYASDRPDLILAASTRLSGAHSFSNAECDEIERLGYALRQLAAIEEAEETGGLQAEDSWRRAFMSDSTNSSAGWRVTASG